MAFGLIQWLISFTVFLIVLTVITWSAVHLGKKSQNSTDIILRFLDANDYLIEREKYVYVYLYFVPFLSTMLILSVNRIIPRSCVIRRREW